MFFAPIINRFGIATLAEGLGLPAKNIRRWLDLDSIPAEWFSPVVRFAAAAGYPDITHEFLSSRAEARRLSLKAMKARDAEAA